MAQPIHHRDGAPELGPERFAPEHRRRLSAPGLRSFLAIADSWGLSERQRLAALGYPPRATFYRWRQVAARGGQITLSVDQLSRISAVLGIYKALRIIFGDDGRDWLHAPNEAPIFGGQRPVDVVTSGTLDGMMLVRRYLDAWRGGIFAAPSAQVPSGWEPADVLVSDDTAWPG